MNTCYKILLTACSLTLFALTGYAQGLQGKSESHAKKYLYKIRAYSGKDDFKILILANIKNKLSTQKLSLSPTADVMSRYSNLLKMNRVATNLMVANALPLDKLNANKDEDLFISYYFNDSGLLKEVTFSVSPNTMLDAFDLEKLEDSLVDKVQAVPLYDIKGSNYIAITDSYRFSDLLKVKNQK